MCQPTRQLIACTGIFFVFCFVRSPGSLRVSARTNREPLVLFTMYSIALPQPKRTAHAIIYFTTTFYAYEQHARVDWLHLYMIIDGVTSRQSSPNKKAKKIKINSPHKNSKNV